MIPQKIHYIWLGGKEFSPLVDKCIESWNRILAGYEICFWNEENLDLSHPIVKRALKKKMWAFASDYLRLSILKTFGGIYLDTDIEVVKKFDDLLEHKCFIGRESSSYISAGVIGAEKNNAFIEECLSFYEKVSRKDNGFITIPKVLTSVYSSSTNKNEVAVLQERAFYPYNPYDHQKLVKQLFFSDVCKDTYAIHHWEKSWNMSFKNKVINYIKKKRGTIC